jgi:hypothetical protein
MWKCDWAFTNQKKLQELLPFMRFDQQEIFICTTLYLPILKEEIGRISTLFSVPSCKQSSVLLSYILFIMTFGECFCEYKSSLFVGLPATLF